MRFWDIPVPCFKKSHQCFSWIALVHILQITRKIKVKFSLGRSWACIHTHAGMPGNSNFSHLVKLNLKRKEIQSLVKQGTRIIHETSHILHLNSLRRLIEGSQLSFDQREWNFQKEKTEKKWKKEHKTTIV